MASLLHKRIEISIGKVLSSKGYIRRGSTWLLQQSKLTQGVWVERGRLSESYDLFLGVWLSLIDQYHTYNDEPECHIQTPLDMLVPVDDRGEFLRRCDFTGRDYEFTVEEKIEIMAERLGCEGLDWLSRLDSAEKIKEVLVAGALEGRPAMITLQGRQRLADLLRREL
jgi:hypothetical protein